MGTVSSRILRRSQITALWEESESVAWRQEVANQAGHSLDTAARYYDYSEKIISGKKVLERLRNLREKSATNEV